MSKYSIEDKRKYIKLIETGKHSIRSAAKEVGASKSVGERWLKTYQSLGIEALIKKPRNHYTKYSSEFKLYAIEYKKVYSLNSRKRKATNKEKTKIISELRQKYKLTLLLEVSGLSRSVCYYHLNKLNKSDKYANIKKEIQKIHYSSKGRYGYRRIILVLRNKGVCINHRTVQKLMRELGIMSQVRMKRHKSFRGEVGKVEDNILERDFTATKPLEKCATDITEFSLFGEKLNLSPIIDLYNGEILSYEISERPILPQAMNMLDKLYTRHKNLKEMILHSDQGWQYQHKSHQTSLKEHEIRQSMSRKGNCLDNAVIENFLGLLKAELLYLQKFKSIELGHNL